MVPDLDDELFPLAETLGDDFGRYRNHCLRVLTFTFYLLPEEDWKKMPKVMELAAVALAYHDIGLWVDGGKLDYIEPSIEKLHKDLHDKFTAQEIGIMKEIIDQHHSFAEYTSSYGEAATAIVNAVRKADLVDFSWGIIKCGVPPGLIEMAYDKIPENGFHKMLASMPARLSPGSLAGQMDIFKIFKW
eukprot:CAMPEP_0116999186 /NCGR_PEP_ID=MMETSP0472-20121206/1995_1 /TAXON_ID=693140 ORGANISM="Tiarina fusus, Strain LIS" /NCGR_SAMPLE_ID=MMETSP0472 /ASSEMBLY_ACC=CAM_ASM_000603 /LENGTH=187 /DNA_ID=CAMNT_0004698561 /DNA_START=345 /DNA_END=908 /DNA_ORIENTATION=+